MLRSSPPDVSANVKQTHTRTTAPKRDLNKPTLQLY